MARFTTQLDHMVTQSSSQFSESALRTLAGLRSAVLSDTFNFSRAIRMLGTEFGFTHKDATCLLALIWAYRGKDCTINMEIDYDIRYRKFNIVVTLEEVSAVRVREVTEEFPNGRYYHSTEVSSNPTEFLHPSIGSNSHASNTTSAGETPKKAEGRRMKF